MPAPARKRPGPVAPPAMLGVMGGGQLGRMFVHAAQAMGYRTAVLDPDPASPAGGVAPAPARGLPRPGRLLALAAAPARR
jgi:phosphoglycerate dehydrogenase-like enzyme